ncbi:MAG: oligosaccharide flippase family protein [Micavibrio sp.]|nr:oligosaccharide flippase family protein [Micavibrio sp.]
MKIFASPAFRSLFLMGIRAFSLVAKFVLTLFLARYLSFEALGIYGLISAAAIIAPSVLGFGFPITITRSAVYDNISEITAKISNYALICSILYIFVLISALIYGFMSGNMLLALLTLAIIALEHLNQDAYALFLNLSKPISSNILHFMRSGLWIVLYIGAALISEDFRNLEAVFIFWLAGNATCFAGGLILMKNWPWKAPQVTKLREWFFTTFKTSRTIYMNGLANSAGTYIDRYIITFFLGLELTGVYVLYWSVFSALMNLIRTGIIQLNRPKLVKHFREKSTDYNHVLKKTLLSAGGSALALGIAAAGFLYLLLPYLDKPLAMEWYPLLLPITGALFLFIIAEVLGLIFYSQHKDGLTLRTSLTQLCIAAVLNMALIPFFGLWGAAIALALTAMCLIGVEFFYVKKYNLLHKGRPS